MAYSISLSEKELEDVSGSQWDNLSENISPGLRFLNKDWYSAWEHKYLVHEYPDLRVKYLSIFDKEDQLQGIFPNIKITKYGLNILSLAGLYYPFRSVLFSSSNAIDCAQAFVDAIQQSSGKPIVRIGPTVEDEAANKAIRTSFLKQGWKSYQINRGYTQVVPLPASVDEFRQQLDKKFIKNINKREAKLHRLGEVDYIKYNDCDQEMWVSAITSCASVEEKSWLVKSKEGESRINDNSEFWKQYLQGDSARKRTTIWVIKLNGNSIAFSFAIDSGSCRYSFCGHHNEDYSKLGVGVLVRRLMYEDAIEKGLTTLDLGTGEALHKSRWGAKPGSRVIDYIYLPPSFTGWSIYSGLIVRDKLREYKSYLSAS